MSLKQTGWMSVVFVALLISGCGTNSNNPLKPPSVYKGPEISVTHAPTEIALDPATIEASASATVEPIVIIQPPDEPTEDQQQFLMDEIEGLLTKIESKLDQTDVNP
jgi:hypothetical protein